MRPLELIRHAASLVGRITDAATGAPLAGAVVRLTDGPPAWTAKVAARAAAGTGSPPLDQQAAGRDGSYRFLDLPAGNYTVEAFLPAAGTRYARASKVAAVAAPPAAVADLTLSPTRVGGKVVLPGGAAACGATVTVLGSGEVAVADAAGNYLLAGLEAGARTLRPAAAVVGVQVTRAVALTAGENLTAIDFALV